MNNTSDDPGDNDSMNSFGDYRPYSEGNRTQNQPINITQHTLPEPETHVEEDKENENSSSDTANFFQNSPQQNLSFDTDFVAPPNPGRLISSTLFHTEDRYESSVSGSVSDNGSVTRSTRTHETHLISPAAIIPLSQQAIPMLGRNSSMALGDSYSESEHDRTTFGEQVEEILDDLVYITNKEKSSLKETKALLKEQKNSFEEFYFKERDKLHSEQHNWEQNLAQSAYFYTPPKDIIELNIGGTLVATTRNVLCKYENSALAAMLNGKHKMKMHKGRLFIDREGETFCMVLSYLRNNKIPQFSSKSQENLFFEELDYWQIPAKIQTEEIPEFDSAWCAPTLKLESNNMVVRKHGPQHGVVFCKFPLTGTRQYIEFKVTMNIQVRAQKSSLFIGLADRSKYKPDQLVSTFWRDSPSSFYCDIWNGKLVKVDNNGRQVGSIMGYGCQCQDSDVNILGMMYDEKNGTLSYWKNGVDMGIAFHDVPKNLYPAIDLWFESGHVEVLNRNKPIIKEYL